VFPIAPEFIPCPLLQMEEDVTMVEANGIIEVMEAYCAKKGDSILFELCQGKCFQ
jgi:hypothetical protein